MHRNATYRQHRHFHPSGVIHDTSWNIVRGSLDFFLSFFFERFNGNRNKVLNKWWDIRGDPRLLDILPSEELRDITSIERGEMRSLGNEI